MRTWQLLLNEVKHKMLNYAFQDPKKSVKTSSKERLKCKDSLFADFCLCTGKIHLHPSLMFGGNSDLSYLLLSSCWKAISERAQAEAINIALLD